VHLGTWMPFGRAAKELEHFRGVEVSRPTAERLTEAAGSAYVARQTAEVERIEKELPASSTGPERQLLSVDGAMVPLVGEDWAEVKTLDLGEVQPPVEVKGEQSDWIQGFIDFHRPDAVRILDFPHAAEHLYAVGRQSWARALLKHKAGWQNTCINSSIQDRPQSWQKCASW
jgi:hypothetical protein